MRIRAIAWLPGLVLLGVLPAWPGQTLELRGTWWQAPAQETRHTTLVASFDSTENNDADYARGMTASSGYGMNPDVEGLHGSGAQLTEESGYALYRGGSNFQGLHGTLRLAVRGPIWDDPKPRWLFESKAMDQVTNVVSRIGVQRAPGKLSLVFTIVPRRWNNAEEIARLDLDIGEVSTDGWHSVVASWDRDSATGWIALDGQGVSGQMDFSDVEVPAYVVYVGAGSYALEPNGLNPAGSVTVDDLVLYDQSLPSLEAEPVQQLAGEDAELLPVVEAAARKSLNVLADLQHLGGWAYAYTWPTLIEMDANYREYVWPDDYYFNIDKGNSGLGVVQNFSYGYEVLGDHRYIGVMTQMAEALLAGQQAGGYWDADYYITPQGLQPVNPNFAWIKFQDHVQSYSMFFLAYMHRLTGDQRYLDAVMKAGEFYLTVQNPNGSFPFRFDARDGMGKTSTGLPQGGELNDGATNDAIDVMAFMYHMTGDARYIQAMKRIGYWLIEAQGKDIPLWADQYDENNNPTWARNFEPPAYGYSAIEYATQCLREMYRFSGDQRYLDAMRTALTWIEANFPDGQMSYYIELGTGRPIAAWDKKIYYFDQPEDVAYLKTVPIGTYLMQRHPVLNTVRGTVATLAKPDAAPITPAAALQALPGLRGQVQSALSTQRANGMWVRSRAGLGDVGDLAPAVQWEVRTLLRYIEDARMALGEIPAERRGQADPRTTAYPYPDWYEVDWAANTR